MEIDLNTLVVNGLFIPPLLVFVTQWLKGFTANKKYHVLLPFILGFGVSLLLFGFGTTFALYGLLFGAIATGEYRFIKE